MPLAFADSPACRVGDIRSVVTAGLLPKVCARPDCTSSFTRFGHGTFQQIIAERNKQIREEKERIAEQKRIAAKKRKEMQDMLLIFGIAGGVAVIFVLSVIGFVALS